MPHKDPEAAAAYRRAYHAEYDPQYYADNGDRIRARARANAKRKAAEARQRCLDAYGAVCACCGEDEPLFLQFDHVNGDGADHRRALFGDSRKGGGSYTFYRWVIKNSFPDTLQVLCANCNGGKHRNGGVCPHQARKEVLPDGTQ